MTEAFIPRIVGFPLSESQVLMTPAEVAALFRVDPKTVTRWSQKGKLHCIKTVGGHRRYLMDEVQALLEVLKHKH